jgi:hypothetical protein
VIHESDNNCCADRVNTAVETAGSKNNSQIAFIHMLHEIISLLR